MELNVSIKRIEKKPKYMCISGINNKRRKGIASIGKKKKSECHLRMIWAHMEGKKWCL